MTHYTTLNYEIDAHKVVHLTLNQADTHNALSPLMMQELTQAFDRIGENPAIRAVVLSAEGESFCAGGDLKWMQANLQATRAERIEQSRLLSALFSRIDCCPKLVVAAVNGAAYGGGIGLMCVCDVVICADRASFALSEVKLGLVPANIAPYVLRKIGAAAMRRVALNAKRFDTSEALSLGLVDNVAPSEALADRVQHEIQALLACGPQAVSRTKQLIAELDAGEVADIPAHLVEVLADVWQGEEAQSGIRAFFERQPAPWKP